MTDTIDIINLAQSLKGQTVNPLKNGYFNGLVFVPKKYFTAERTESQALLAYLDDLYQQEDILK